MQMRAIPMAFNILKPYIPNKQKIDYLTIPFTEIDTDGYYSKKFTGAVAVIPAIGSKKVWNLNKICESSTETEWASIALGVRSGLDKNQTLIALSNDNLGVVQSLIHSRPVKNEQCLFWYYEIQKLIVETMGFKIRWIPREYNRAGKGPEYEEIYKKPNHKSGYDVDWRR
jgi:hypothetical protein